MRFTAFAVAATVLALVSGCTPKPVEPLKPVTPVPERSERLFATPGEALAAAEAAYAEYQAMSNLIASEGGKDPERIAPYVTEEYLKDELDVSALFSKYEIRAVGEATFDSMRLQQYFESSDGHTVVVVYVCNDVSPTRIIDKVGVDVTPDRAERLLLEVEFEARGPEPIEMLVSRSDIWDETVPC